MSCKCCELWRPPHLALGFPLFGWGFRIDCLYYIKGSESRLAWPFPNRQSKDARSGRHRRLVYDSRMTICPRVCSWCICRWLFLHIDGWKWVSSSFPAANKVISFAGWKCTQSKNCLPFFLPSFHPTVATPDLSKIELITLIMFHFFSLVLCRGQKRGEIKSGRHIKSSAIVIEIIQIAWGALLPFCYSAVMCSGSTDIEVLANSKIAEQSRAGRFRPEGPRPKWDSIECEHD